jgi:high-affinity Fe2+/Pb2+ permease
MIIATILKLAAWGIIVAVVLQIIFYFVFQIIGYDTYLLSNSLVISIIAVLLLLVGWMTLKKQLN